MITDPIELSELQETTKDLINNNPSLITLNRAGFLRTPGGGQARLPSSPEATPKVRYFGAITGDPVYITRDEGEQVRASHVIIGMPDDVIEAKDTFRINGRDFEVLQIHPDKSFQVKGWVREAAPHA